ncbi:conserved hypothetical protein [Planktothrix agardhii]|nr:conserved hypothetical protein [Planktothrix agardhii]
MIDSTQHFETDLATPDQKDKATVITKINHCASLFPSHKANVYHQLHH